MPTETDFETAFSGCRTVPAVNALYKTLFSEHIPSPHEWKHSSNPIYLALSNAARRACERLSIERRVDQSPAPNDGRVRPRVLRNWCLQQGIPLAKKGRVPMSVENQYREEHDMPLLETKDRGDTKPSSSVDSARVRSWARTNGIPVGSRGRVHPDLIKQFLEAQ